MKDAFVCCADLCQPYRFWNYRVKYGQVFSRVRFDGGNNIPVELRFIRHRQEYTADFQLGIALPLDTPHCAYQLCHVFRCQIVSLNGRA